MLFSTNVLCFYHATLYIPSGMSAVIFASATIFNGLNLWLYEEFVWQTVSVVGVVFSLLGNLVIFAPPVREWRWRPAKAVNDTCS